MKKTVWGELISLKGGSMEKGDAHQARVRPEEKYEELLAHIHYCYASP